MGGGEGVFFIRTGGQGKGEFVVSCLLHIL
jgi:hypothetical protein